MKKYTAETMAEGPRVTELFKTPDSRLELHRYSKPHKASYYRRLGSETIIVSQGNVTINGKRIEHGELVSIEPGLAVDLEIEAGSLIASVIKGPTADKDVFPIPGPRSIQNDDKVPLVTFVVTAFNVEEVLTTTLLSIIEQSYSNIEIVVVDDASTDDTASVLGDFAAQHPCVRVITNEKNLGAALSKQKGILAAAGEFFILCDGDDFIEPNTISESMKTASLTGADCIVFGFDHISSETGARYGATLPIDESKLPYVLNGREEFDPDRMSRLSHISPVCLLKTSVHQKPFADALQPIPYFEDIPTYIAMLAKANTVAFVNEPFYHYRIGRAGQSVNSWTKARRGMKAASLIKAVDYMLSQSWAEDDFTRKLLVFKLGRIAINEFTVMRGAGNDHEYELTIMLFKTVMNRFQSSDMFVTKRLKFLIFLLALRWAPIPIVRRVFAKGRR